MKIINLSGDVGWEITDRLVTSLLPKNGIEEVLININSYGGDSFEAFAIYNTIKNYPGELTTVIKGIAASAAGIIYLAGKTKKVYKNSTFMAHPAWGFAIGEGDILISRGKMLNGITEIIAEDLSSLMDKEKTIVLEELKSEIWLVGWEQIVNEGLADEVIDSEDQNNIETIEEITNKILIIKEKLSTKVNEKVENKLYEKVAASIKENSPALPGNNNLQEEADMTLKEYLEKFPEAKAEIDASVKSAMAKGIEKSIAEDRDRSAKVLKLAGVNDTIIESVKNGQTSGDFAEAEILKQNEARKKLAIEKPAGIETLNVAGQLPKDTKPDPVIQPAGIKNATKEQAKEIDAWDKMYNKDGGK